MVECVVKSCKSRSNCELFCAPEDKNKLRKWQMTIGTNLNEFLICEKHFPKESVIVEKSLALNAFPSLLLKPSDYRIDSSCSSCFKKFELNEERAISGLDIVELMKKFGHEIKINTSICQKCDEIFSNLKIILMIQEMKKKNPPEIKQEVIEIDDDEEVVTKGIPVKPVQLKVIPNLPKVTLAKPPTLNTKIVMPISSSSTTVCDFMIPLKDASDDKPKSNLVTKRRQSLATPMTVISNSCIQSSMNHNVVEKDTTMTMLTKRRASVPNITTTVNDERLTATGTLPSKEFHCQSCNDTFQTSLILRLHEEKWHSNSRKKKTHPRTGIHNFQCVNCLESFSSYYYLRLHRKTCIKSVQIKCSYEYCRFRGSNATEINTHFNKYHTNKIKCNDCHEFVSSREQLIVHQRLKHEKKESDLKPTRKRAPPKKYMDDEMSVIKRTRIDSKGEVEKVNKETQVCVQCDKDIPLSDLINHRITCKKLVDSS